MTIKKLALTALLLAILLSSTGCVATVLGLAGAGVATAVESVDEVVERSYTQPYWCVYRATHAALYEMSINVTSIEPTQKGDYFHGSTAEYPVRIELHRVTDKVVRVTVEAGKNIFQQDKATASAVAQTIQDVITRNVVAMESKQKDLMKTTDSKSDTKQN